MTVTEGVLIRFIITSVHSINRSSGSSYSIMNITCILTKLSSVHNRNVISKENNSTDHELHCYRRYTAAEEITYTLWTRG